MDQAAEAHRLHEPRLRVVARCDAVPRRETLPEWTEYTQNDLGVLLVELFAYGCDITLFYQETRIAANLMPGTADEPEALVQLLRLHRLRAAAPHPGNGRAGGCRRRRRGTAAGHPRRPGRGVPDHDGRRRATAVRDRAPGGHHPGRPWPGGGGQPAVVRAGAGSRGPHRDRGEPRLLRRQSQPALPARTAARGGRVHRGHGIRAGRSHPLAGGADAGRRDPRATVLYGAARRRRRGHAAVR